MSWGVPEVSWVVPGAHPAGIRRCPRPFPRDSLSGRARIQAGAAGCGISPKKPGKKENKPKAVFPKGTWGHGQSWGRPPAPGGHIPARECPQSVPGELIPPQTATQGCPQGQSQAQDPHPSPPRAGDTTSLGQVTLAGMSPWVAGSSIAQVTSCPSCQDLGTPQGGQQEKEKGKGLSCAQAGRFGTRVTPPWVVP